MNLNLKSKLSIISVMIVMLTGASITVGVSYMILLQSREENNARLSISKSGFNDRLNQVIQSLDEKYEDIQKNKKLNSNIYYIVTGGLLQYHMIPDIMNLIDTLNIESFAFYPFDKERGGIHYLSLYGSRKLGGNVILKNKDHHLYTKGGFGSTKIKDPEIFPKNCSMKERTDLISVENELFIQKRYSYRSFNNIPGQIKQDEIGHFVFQKRVDFNIKKLELELGVKFIVYNRSGEPVSSNKKFSNLEEKHINSTNTNETILIEDINKHSYDALISTLKVNGEISGYLIVGIPQSVVNQKIAKANTWVISISLAVIGMMLLLIYRLVDRFIDPIKELTIASIALASGDLNRKVKCARRDEIGVLADNFSHMADSIKQKVQELSEEIEIRKKVERELEKYRLHLEDLVQERTQELLESQKRFQDIAMSSADWIWEMDLDGKYTFISGATSEILGYSQDELLENSAGSLVQLQNSKAFMGLYSELTTRKGQLVDFESIFTTKSGDHVYILTNSVPMLDNKDQVVGYRGVNKDISARKEAERKFNDLNRRLFESARDAGRAEIATGVIHNIGNALNSVLILVGQLRDIVNEIDIENFNKSASLLEDNLDNPDDFFSINGKGRIVPNFIRLCSSDIEEKRSSLSQLIDELSYSMNHIREIVRLQQRYGSKSSNFSEKTSLDEIIHDVLKMVDRTIHNHSVQITCYFDEIERAWFDRSKIIQILVNILTNAIKAVKGNKNDRSISIETFTNKNRKVFIVVSDNGIGIEIQHLDSIFKYGFTLDENGNGFGLHSAANMAKEMGGSLNVQSEGLGKGSRFILELPLKFDADSAS